MALLHFHAVSKSRIVQIVLAIPLAIASVILIEALTLTKLYHAIRKFRFVTGNPASHWGHLLVAQH